jgi:hypothetical protein
MEKGEKDTQDNRKKLKTICEIASELSILVPGIGKVADGFCKNITRNRNEVVSESTSCCVTIRETSWSGRVKETKTCKSEEKTG